MVIAVEPPEDETRVREALPAPAAGALTAHAPLVAVLVVVVVALRRMFSAGYIVGSDTLAHLFRVQQVSTWLHHPGRMFDWTDLWYTGFHQFALYPYLSYFPAGLLDAVTGAPVASMKAVIMAAVLLGATGVYFGALELLREERGGPAKQLAAAGGALVFALSPAFLGFMFGFGEYSDFVALGFAPLVFLAFLRAVRVDSGVSWILYGCAMASLVLLHPHVALFAAIGALAYLVLSPHASSRAVFGLVYAGALALLLTLYFWVPFLWLRGSAGDPSLGTPFTDPIWAVEPGDYFDRDRGLRYFGLVAAGLAAAALLWRSRRREVVPLAAMTLTGVVLALGGKLPISSNLPLLDLANPERALTLVLTGGALLAAIGLHGLVRELEGSLPAWQASVVVAGVIGLALADTYFFNANVARTTDFSPDFLAVNRYLQRAGGGPFDRTAFLQDDYNLSAYSPLLSGRPTIDGSQVEGSRAATDVALATQMMPDQAGLSQSVALFSRLGVRWVVINSVERGRQLDIIKDSGLFQERYADGRYVLFERLWSPASIRAVGPRLLTIGDGAGAPIIARLATCLDIRVERGPSTRLDDYTPGALSPFGIVVLARPVIRDPAAVEGLLSEYTAAGGVVVRDEPPAMTCEGNVTGEQREFHATPTIATHQGGNAVLSMGYSPAWKVVVDGEPVDTWAQGGLLGFSVPSGSHDIAVHYRMPVVQRLAQVVSIIAWITTLGWLAITVRRRRSGRGPEQEEAAGSP